MADCLFHTGTPSRTRVRAGAGTALCLLVHMLAWAQETSLEQRYERAVQLFQEGKTAEAENEFHSISQALPQAPEPYFFLGRICLLTHRATEAETWLVKAVSLNNRFADAWKVLGQLYTEQDKPQKAKEVLLKVIELEPSSSNAHFNLGLILEKLGHDQGAIREFEASMKLAPSDSSLRLKARTNAGLLHLKLGRIYHESQRNSEAVRELEAAQSLISPSYELYALLGSAYQKMEDPRALEFLLKAAELLSQETVAQRLDQTVPPDQRLTESVEALTEKVKSQPDNVLLHIQLGSLFWDQSEYYKALHHYEQVARLDPDSARASYLVGYLHRLLGNRTAAKESLKRALRLDPELLPTQLTLGEVLAGEGNWQQALPLLEKASKNPANDISVRLKLGQLFLDNGNLSLARQELEAARNLAPDNKKVYYMLGRLYTALNRPDLAEREFTIFSRMEAVEEEQRRSR